MTERCGVILPLDKADIGGYDVQEWEIRCELEPSHAVNAHAAFGVVWPPMPEPYEDGSPGYGHAEWLGSPKYRIDFSWEEETLSR